MGPVLDERLEAVAGVPGHEVSVPTRFSSFEGTLIFAGVLVPTGGQQATISRGIFQYVENSGEWGARKGALVRINRSGGLYGVGGVTVERGTAGLGITATGVSPWAGPMLALAYDRTLTDYQIQRVIQHLKRELQA